MVSIGLDIGTTTICGIAADGKTGALLDSVALKNQFLQTEREWAKIQDPKRILASVQCILNKIIKRHKNVSCMGITGQMHGILYLDSDGNPVSPLYTWQDQRGSLEYIHSRSYAKYVSETTGYNAAAGYGIVTHFYNAVNNLVPKNARSFCTIHDYIAMALSGNVLPHTDATDAASLGLFDLGSNTFDKNAINKLGMSENMLPEISENTTVLGKYAGEIPVTVAIGDNQASFIGSVRDSDDSVLVNVGTGSQISLYSSELKKCASAETRPFVDSGFLLAGASLCGGRAYAMLEKFFNDIVEISTGSRCSDMYGIMENITRGCMDFPNPPTAVTTFCGTRESPDKKGAILNIGIDNFTPPNFIIAILQGIVAELYDMYSHMKNNAHILVGSGNGLRKNALLRKLFSQRFNMPLLIPLHKEEAAYGAALNALVGVGCFDNINEAQKLIKYECEE